jgi:hypothetical protein
MVKEDVTITISDNTGKNVYIQAYVTRALAREVESLLEKNNAFTFTPFNNKTHKKRVEYA